MNFVLDNILIILFLPLWVGAVFVLNSLVGFVQSKRTTMILTVLSTLVGLVFSAILLFGFYNSNTPAFEDTTLWFQAGNFNFYLGVLVDKISSLFLFILMSVSILVQIYSYSYMYKDEHFNRYYAYLNLFNFAMAGLILSSNLLQTYAFWELVGVSSYLLIGFWYKNYVASNAAKKAFIVNRIGDSALLFGIVILCYFSSVYSNASGSQFLAFSSIGDLAEQVYAFTSSIGFYFVCILLLLGAIAKSAQFPLHVWLADAMQAPTPVSALIHAATMVAAGIYLVVRLYPMFSMSSCVMETILYIGLFTAFITAYFALTQTDIKKMLAYSTSSQLGLMFVGLGIMAPSAALFHLTTHAYTKALLFLTSGVIIKCLSGVQDMRQMGGLRKENPLAALCYLIGAISLSGLFLGCYFSKESILGTIFASGNMVLTSIFIMISFMTAFYIFKSYFMIFEGEKRNNAVCNDTPFAMKISIIVLMLLTVIVGYLFVKIGFEKFINPFGPDLIIVHHNMILFASLIAAGMAILLSAFVVFRGKSTSFLPPVLYKLSCNKFYIDEINQFWIQKVFVRICDIVEFIDRNIIDGIVKLIALVTRGFAYIVSKLQNGNVQTYLAYSVFVIGSVLLTVVMFYFWLLKG